MVKAPRETSLRGSKTEKFQKRKNAPQAKYMFGLKKQNNKLAGGKGKGRGATAQRGGGGQDKGDKAQPIEKALAMLAGALMGKGKGKGEGKG